LGNATRLKKSFGSFASHGLANVTRIAATNEPTQVFKTLIAVVNGFGDLGYWSGFGELEWYEVCTGYV